MAQNNISDLLSSLKAEGDILAGKVTVDPVSEQKKTKTIPSVEYSLSLAAYPDFIVTRKSKKTTKHLVVMPSAGYAFVKTEKGNDSISAPLTEAEYTAFTSGMPDIPLPEGFWTKSVQKGVHYVRPLLRIMEDDDTLEWIRKHGVPESVDVIRAYEGNAWYGGCMKYVRAFKKYPSIYLEVMGMPKAFEILVESEGHDDAPGMCHAMEETFGLDNLRVFLHNFEESLIEGGSMLFSPYTYSLSRRVYADCQYFPDIKMDFSSFMHFVLFESVRMGYAKHPMEFTNIWKDTIDMQKILYKKVKYKYPKDLLLLHQQLSYKCECMKEFIDEERFADQSHKAETYEGKYKGFVFLAPKERQDFLDEATAQSNCLAGYIDKFISGACIILFMRKESKPDKSYATVELVNGAINQAKLARNKDLDYSSRKILEEWIESCNNRILEKSA